jgi:putative ABC transport system permease protein
VRLIDIPLRNLRLRALSATLTGASIALGTMLVAFLWIAADEAKRKYDASSKGFKAIVGPTGTSGLDLVLNTVFNLGTPKGVVPLSVYKALHADKILPRGRVGMRHAVPIAVGDNYRGYRVVATTDEWFTKFTRGDLGPLAFAAGRGFEFSHDEFMELAEHLAEDHAKKAAGEHEHAHEIPEKWKAAVLGAEVARKLELPLGSEVVPAHGVEGEHEEHEEAACKVVGILAPTGTPIDRAVYIPLGTHYLLEGHDAISSVQTESSADKVRISAVIVDTRDHVGPQKLRHVFQERQEAQVVFTADEIDRLFEIAGNITAALRAIAMLVMAVAGIGILVALYNTMNERKREIAIMRSLGARRVHILSIVLIEASLIAAVGGVLGVAGAHLAANLLGGPIQAMTGVSVAGASFKLTEVWLILGTTALGALAGVLPAVKASLTGVADNLSPTT